MPTGPLALDSLLSYARVDGPQVRVVLVLSEGAEVVGPGLFVRFQNGKTGFRSPAVLDRDSGRTRLELKVPREKVTDGTWQLRLRDVGDATVRNLRARIHLAPGQPIALLFGKTPNIT